MAAALAFTANLGGPTLPPLDDCFYAQKAAEMAHRPRLTVTWAGNPAFQNPPGQFWLMAACMRVIGANDAAARLPSALMAVGALAATAWIGARLVSPAAGLAAATLLAIAPFFLNNARRAMLEIPLLFWTLLAMAALVAWRRRPAAVLLFAPALGMAILTKSVLGLLPLALALAAPALPAWRALAREPRFWIAAALGLALGATWPVHQWLTHGRAFLDVHFAGEIAARSLASTGWAARVAGYPVILFTQHQPEFLAGLVASLLWLRQARRRIQEPDAIVMLWAWLPLAGLALSSAQSARYAFPLAPAFALVGGAWLAERWPRAAGVAGTRVVPALLLAGAIIFWWHPEWLGRDTNRPFREAAAILAERVPPGTEIAFWGDDYWRIANPLLWYDHLRLGPSAASPREALIRARSGGNLLMCERLKLLAAPELASATRLLETRDAVLLDLGR